MFLYTSYICVTYLFWCICRTYFEIITTIDTAITHHRKSTSLPIKLLPPSGGSSDLIKQVEALTVTLETEKCRADDAESALMMAQHQLEEFNGLVAMNKLIISSSNIPSFKEKQDTEDQENDVEDIYSVVQEIIHTVRRHRLRNFFSAAFHALRTLRIRRASADR